MSRFMKMAVYCFGNSRLFKSSTKFLISPMFSFHRKTILRGNSKDVRIRKWSTGSLANGIFNNNAWHQTLIRSFGKVSHIDCGFNRAVKCSGNMAHDNGSFRIAGIFHDIGDICEVERIALCGLVKATFQRSWLFINQINTSSYIGGMPIRSWQEE